MSKQLGVLLVLGFLLGADEAKQSGQSKKDLDQMQGNWQAAAVTVKGRSHGAEGVKEIKLIVKKEEYRVQVGGKDHVSAKLVLRADKKPKEVDLVLETGPVYKGIYEIDGDTLNVCLSLSSDADSERPKELRSELGSPTALFSWQRTK